MSVKLYKFVDGAVESGDFDPLQVSGLLKDGYKCAPEELKPKRKAKKTTPVED